MKVIGVAGQMRVGKNTVADYLASKLTYLSENGFLKPWEQTAFADAVKKVFCDAFGKNLDFVENWKVNPESPPGFKKTVRQTLQFIGDGFRSIYPRVWLEMCFNNIKHPTIISDCRYLNELRCVQESGGVNILVYRSGYLNKDPNGSEAQIRPLIEFLVRNGCEGVLDHDELRSQTDWFDDLQLIDYFLRNDGTSKELFDKINKRLFPYVVYRLGNVNL